MFCLWYVIGYFNRTDVDILLHLYGVVFCFCTIIQISYFFYYIVVTFVSILDFEREHSKVKTFVKLKV